MRTTVTLDDDVEAAIERLQREQGVGRSEALNALARRGIAAPEPSARYVHRSADLGIRIDVTDIGEVLELLDES